MGWLKKSNFGVTSDERCNFSWGQAYLFTAFCTPHKASHIHSGPVPYSQASHIHWWLCAPYERLVVSNESLVHCAQG